MKTDYGIQTILVIGLISFATPAKAGTPDQDPYVKARRERFQEASHPTLEELQLGKTWYCMDYAAIKNEISMIDPRKFYRFTYFDEHFINEIAFKGARTTYIYNSDGTEESMKLNQLIGKTTFTGTLSNRTLYSFIRVTDQGDLIIEIAGSPNKYEKGVSAISDRSMIAYFYRVCPKYKAQD